MSFVVFAFIERGRNRACLITKLAKILDIRAMHAYDLACFDKNICKNSGKYMDTHHDTCRCIIDPVDGITVDEKTEIDSG